MKVVTNAFKFLLFVGLCAFLHYNLPQHDIVRIVDTEVSRVDKKDGSFGRGEPDVGTERLGTIDVRYISTMKPNGKPMVYRNQDTGWGWPPYFKFDTGDLMAEAQDYAAKNGDESQIWVPVKHYGWRIKLFSLYPNAISIGKPVAGPNARIIPWFNIIFLTVFFGFLFFLWWTWRGFRKKRIDPVTEKIGAGVDAAVDKVGDTVEGATSGMRNSESGLRKFMRRWFGSK